MKVQHMQPHPTEAGFVWDANGVYDDAVGGFVGRYFPDPRHNGELRGPADVDAFNAAHPDIRHAMAIWGQTAAEQRATSDRLMAEAAKCAILCSNCHWIEEWKKRVARGDETMWRKCDFEKENS